MCITCGRYFTSPANRNNHVIVHVEKNVVCPGCPRRFSRKSAMILHLEAGTCDSRIDLEDLNELASQCHQADHYEGAGYNSNY
ncbi:hypothetical protein PENANT_c015G07051, partial [Penicillium antarcticum]